MRRFRRPDLVTGPFWAPYDMWVGVFWKKWVNGDVAVYVCLVPCFPIRLDWFHVKSAEELEQARKWGLDFLPQRRWPPQ